jgi:hypothetical protein
MFRSVSHDADTATYGRSIHDVTDRCFCVCMKQERLNNFSRVYRDTNKLNWGFPSFCALPPREYWDSTMIMPRMLPSTSFPINYSLPSKHSLLCALRWLRAPLIIIVIIIIINDNFNFFIELLLIYCYCTDWLTCLILVSSSFLLLLQSSSVFWLTWLISRFSILLYSALL